ncbi:MAG: xanthine dehydrogenase family protein subunit M [Gemmatimonadales bacterium]|nr:xanthine dehydrogenase family protein subunit M [Gemmatimonadales bacterium]NIN10190.1 xanthine dehydrogenase family protein subunit M [Gemmatimonadales bacterium]NIN48946.1 xanthine dehydrogenase family protein subunit M [Gemmatimonadales bacterium]NIP06410.1 xanthine dehydrogenase family protein subunit M [Gemmatimonadales bacterium]NIQ98762.1 xanthine dehydrogenase family protein subunit M [Gemmatimonadales bacterium]
MLPKFSYVRATSLDEAVRLLSSDDGARVCAGGSDLLGCLRDQVFECSRVVSLTGIDGLRGIARTRDGGVRIGALTTIADVAADPTINQSYPGLAQAAGELASPQLRNQGTIGGNICQKPRCWYYRGDFDCLRKGGTTCHAVAGESEFHCILGGAGCFVVHPSDTAPALVALQATVRIAGRRGTRSVPMEEFYVLPNQDVRRETVLEPHEIVTEIVLPRPAAGMRSSYHKVRARGAWDFALAGVALALQFSGNRVTAGRVVLSGAAPTPWRSREAEEAIIGKQLDAATAAAAGRAAMEDAVPLRRNGYKIPLFQGVIEEALLAIGRA